MNDFFTNLIGRHLGTCDTIQPRIPGRFETEGDSLATASTDEEAGRFIHDHDQPQQTPGELPVDSPTVITQEYHPLDSSNDNSAPSVADRRGHATESVSSKALEGLSESSVSHRNPQITQPLEADIPSMPSALEREQANRAVNKDEQGQFSDRPADEVRHDIIHAPTSRAGEHSLDHELGYRIDAMLKRMVVMPVSPNTEPTTDETFMHVNASQLSNPPANNMPSPDVAASSLEPTPSLDRVASRQDVLDTDDREQSVHNGRLQLPSSLADLESRLSQHSQDIGVKTEAVINVTIGRVEVRAVQAETAKNVKSGKKPTAVMSLGDYLKQRDRGKQA